MLLAVVVVTVAAVAPTVATTEAIAIVAAVVANKNASSCRYCSRRNNKSKSDSCENSGELQMEEVGAL